MPFFVASLRHQRDYLETNVDAISAIFPKTLQPQFGQNYDVKKVRNIHSATRDAPNKPGSRQSSLPLTR